MEHMADPGRIGSSCVLVLTVLLSIEQAIMWVMEHMADPGRIGSSCVLVLTVLLSIDALRRPLRGSWSTWLILVGLGLLVFSF